MIKREQAQSEEPFVYYTYEQFEAFPQVENVVTTRLGGVSTNHLRSLNLSFSTLVGDDEQNVITNRERLYDALGIQACQVAQAELVHGSHVVVVDEGTPRSTHYKIPETDGLVTNIPGIALFIPVADCAAIAFFDPKARVIAMIHAGWRGAVRGIIPETLRLMGELGSNPTDTLVGISPILQRCCYQVKQDMVDTVVQAFPSQAYTFFEQQADDIHYQFDFLGLLSWQLQESGILPTHIEASGMCTACHTNEFYSHRAERGMTGRFAGLIFMK